MGKWLLLAVSGLLGWQGWEAMRSADGLRHALLTEELILVGPAVLLMVGLTLLAERRWPAVRRPFGAAGHRQDAAYLVLYIVVAVPAVLVLGTGFAVTLFRLAPWLSIHPLATAPRWLVIVAALVVMDGCNWAAHYLNHRITTFWRFHALHHSQEEMSILTSFRAHPLVHASFQVAALPLLVLGTSGALPLTVLVGYVLLSTLPHANVGWDFGPLRKVIVSPAYHRLHHDRTDTRGVNLGTVLVLWDVLAGRAVMPERGAAPVATGLAGRPVAVEQAPAASGAGRWAGVPVMVHQLLEPLWSGERAPTAPAIRAGTGMGVATSAMAAAGVTSG
jgi:sterol desaturase/sphingolipid hydroxylase (fatty acid hydroxylase superfamily)